MSSHLDVHRIEFAVTYRCNSHCKHCQVGEDRRTSRPVALDAGLAGRVVAEVAGAYPVGSVMTWGGESLLSADTVCAIHAAATAAGVPQRQILTNAGWPRDEAAFRALARRLAESGVSQIHISVDAFHQEYIPVALVRQNARALIEAGIPRLAWNPCWVVAPDDANPWNARTRAILAELSDLPVGESEGNVLQPNGNARRYLAEYLPPRQAQPSGRCGEMPYTGRLDEVTCISLSPDGSIEVCNEFAIGNATRGDLLQTLRGYDPYRIPEMQAILAEGTDGLLALARSRGVELDPAGYYSACDLCTSLRGSM